MIVMGPRFLSLPPLLRSLALFSSSFLSVVMLIFFFLLSSLCLNVCAPLQCPTSSPWSQLVQAELQIAPTSREFGELEGFRQSSGSQHNFDQEIERAFVKLSTLFQKRATQHGKNLNRIRSIFSEEQFVKYIEWSHRNGAAAHQTQQAQQAQAQNQSHGQAPQMMHHHHQAHYHQQPQSQSQQYAYAPMYDSPMHGHPQQHSHSMSAPMQQQHAPHHLAIKLE